MKEEDPTILENSSPVRSHSTNNNMGMSSTNASSAAVWTPLKEEQSNQMLHEPIDTIPTDIENVSPMQHLMSDDGNTRRKSIRKSDDDDSNDDHQPAKHIYQKKMVLSFILCLVVGIIAGGVVAAVLILQNKNSSSSSTSSSSNSETNNPPNTPITPPIPAPVTIGKNTTNNSSMSEAPTMMPSIVDDDNNNSTNTNTTMTPTATPVTSNMTNETMVPTATPTNSTITDLPTTLPPTFFDVPTFNNTTNDTLLPTVAPVTAPAPTVSGDNSVKLLAVLANYLLPSDNAALSSSDSIYKQSFDEMITKDSYFTTISDNAHIFQRYILTTLNLHFQIAPTSTTAKPLLVNSVTDHCTWIGIECNMNTTDTITDNLVTDLVWTGYSFTGTIPDSIQYLSSLTKLDFGDNQLTGTIPNVLYNNLTSLEYLFLHSNQFIGTISNDGIGQLSSLRRLYLGNNRFSGTLPDNIGLAKEMRYLNMYNNTFSGRIPTTWDLRYLFYLDLGRNQLTGSIPANWPFDLFDVRIFYLNHNQLSGSFPYNFTSIGNNRISLLQVNDNQLTGIIPSGFNRRQLDLSEFQRNSFSSMDVEFCRNIVWVGGEMVSMRSDCGATCPCQYFCGTDYCY